MNGEEFLRALNAITKEKNIEKDLVIEAMKQALMTAYKKNYDSQTNVKVEYDENTGEFKVISYLVVVEDVDFGSEETDEEGNIVKVPPEINIDAQIILEQAEELVPGITVGETIEKEVTPKDFGRVAAGTAKQVIMQKIREAEKENTIKEFADKSGEMMLGLVALEDQNNYYIDLGKARGILKKTEIIPDEKIVMGTNIRVYITKIEEGPKGPVILLSRKHYGFVKRLFENAVPEIKDGTVEIYSVIREPGIRSKVAVYSNNEKVDPIGTCIGEKGSRIAGILKEMNGEKIDLILYSDNDEEFIKNALSPAKNIIISITNSEKREALAIVDDDNLSLAIGKKGSNIKLASRLTKYKITIKTVKEINEEGNSNEN